MAKQMAHCGSPVHLLFKSDVFLRIQEVPLSSLRVLNPGSLTPHRGIRSLRNMQGYTRNSFSPQSSK